MDSDEIVREWWMPVVREGGKLDWLCDHEGDYLEKIEALWEAYIALQAELAEREQTERDLAATQLKLASVKAHAEAMAAVIEPAAIPWGNIALEAYRAAHPKDAP